MDTNGEASACAIEKDDAMSKRSRKPDRLTDMPPIYGDA